MNADPAPTAGPSERLRMLDEQLRRATSIPGAREKLEAGIADEEPDIRHYCASLLATWGDEKSAQRITRRMPHERDEAVGVALRKSRAALRERFPDPVDKAWVDSDERRLMLGEPDARPAPRPAAPHSPHPPSTRQLPPPVPRLPSSQAVEQALALDQDRATDRARALRQARALEDALAVERARIGRLYRSHLPCAP